MKLHDFEAMPFEDLADDFFHAAPLNPWTEPDFSRCIWNGYRMVTEEEYEAELLAEAV